MINPPRHPIPLPVSVDYTASLMSVFCIKDADGHIRYSARTHDDAVELAGLLNRQQEGR